MTVKSSLSMTVDPSLLKSKIIHVDMDCFYAAVEMRDDPRLKNMPVVVGGNPNSRGVVSTANYLARKFGVHSAMACSKAKRLCPQAIFVRPNFEKYRAVSEEIHRIFSKYTSIIEPVSLDEAYLDVTDNNHNLYAVKIAKLIKEEIFESTHLTASAGVGPNKLVAKIASDIQKPNGITVVIPKEVEEFMKNLPLRKIPGIGPATEKRLKEYGWQKCSDIWPYDISALENKLNQRMANWLYQRSRGIDTRAVVTHRERKSLGYEETFSKDVLDHDFILYELKKISDKISLNLKKRELVGKTVVLKVKYHDFKVITRSQTIDNYTTNSDEIFKLSKRLLEKTDVGKIPTRLAGITVTSLKKTSDIDSSRPTSLLP